jgi:transcription elongation factor SPT6
MATTDLSLSVKHPIFIFILHSNPSPIDDDEEEEEEDDEEDSDDDDSDSNASETRSAKIKTRAASDMTLGKKKKKKRIRKLDAQLDEDDLLLIRESKGEDVSYEEARRRAAAEEALKRKEETERKRRTVVAQTEKELRKGLFNEEDDFVEESSKGTRQIDNYSRKSKQQQKTQQRQRHKPSRAEDEFDEDALDDFIEDDIGDDVEDEYGAAGMRRQSRNRGWRYDDDDDLDFGGAARGGGISEAQWNEANEIFGIDYANVMGGVGGEGEEDDVEGSSKKHRYRERGVGVDMAGESDEDEEEEEEGSEGEDLFGSDEDVPSRREAAKQRRLAREKQKQQRNQQRLERNAEKRRALLRRAYEPIVLIENFCTPMDDEIRKKDIPERFQIMTSSSRMADFDAMEEDADALEERAMWIMAKIPEIATEFFSTTSASDNNINTMQTDEIELLKHQKDILESIQCALKYMKQEKLEPEFIRKYRQDYVTSKAVREHLYDVLDQDTEWNKVQLLRVKAENLLANFASTASKYQLSTTTMQESNNSKEADDALNIARERLDEAVRQEARASEELKKFQQENQTHLEDENSDADDLFGESDEDGVRKFISTNFIGFSLL